MSARTKLNVAVLNISLLVSAVIGAVTGSWLVGFVLFVILAVSACRCRGHPAHQNSRDQAKNSLINA